MAHIDLNEMALRITAKEGKAINLSNAQVKEVLKLTLDELAGLSLEEVAELLAQRKEDE